MNTNSCVAQASIACYSAPSRLALDAHCSPKKTQFATFRGIHTKKLTAEDLYSVLPSGNLSKLQVESLKSFSVWGFYISLLVLIAITKSIALG